MMFLCQSITFDIALHGFILQSYIVGLGFFPLLQGRAFHNISLTKLRIRNFCGTINILPQVIVQNNNETVVILLQKYTVEKLIIRRTEHA